MATGKPAPGFATLGTERVARTGRFQSEHAGCRGWNTYRTATVAGMRTGHKTCGNRSSRAPRRAAGRMRKIPWISGRTEQPGFSGRHQAEFRGRAFSEDGDPGIEET